MTDIIVKIMVEVLLILGTVTKEIKQGRISMSFSVDISRKIDLDLEKYLKVLIGRKDVEDALRRLDKLTQEEARMAAAEVLKITRSLEDNVKNVADKVQGVDGTIQGVDNKVQGVDDRVKGVDDRVKVVCDKVDIVVEGELWLSQPPIPTDPFLVQQRDQSSDSTGGKSSQRYKPFVIS